MSIIGWIIIITSIAGIGGTGLGGLVASFFHSDSDKAVSLLLSFAGGVMLSVVCFDLIDDALNCNSVNDFADLYIVLIGILIGYGLIFLLNFLIKRKTDFSKTKDKRADSFSNMLIAGIVMGVAIALHNLPEGMAIGASFASNNALIVPKGGMLMAIVIGLHNIPEGMAVSTPLISGGVKKCKTVILTALSGSPTVFGAIIGYYLGSLSKFGLMVSLSFASGAMLYVVFGELLPQSVRIYQSKQPAFVTLIGLIVGILIVYA